MVINNETLPTEALFNPETQILSPLADRYLHKSFTEKSDPDLVKTALRIHAAGYLSMGFINRSAITEEGVLAEDIDKTRGENVDYFLTVNPLNSVDFATLRIINIPSNRDYTFLPAYQLCMDKLTDSGLQLLQNVPNQVRSLKEIAALARTKNSSPLSIFESFRNVIQTSIGKNELWFFSIVSSTLDILVHNLGEHSFQVIGEDVAIDDERINPKVRLRPVLFRPDDFLTTMLKDYDAAENPKTKHRILRNFMFFNYGLNDSNKELEVSTAYHDFYNKLFSESQ